MVKGDDGAKRTSRDAESLETITVVHLSVCRVYFLAGSALSRRPPVPIAIHTIFIHFLAACEESEERQSSAAEVSFLMRRAEAEPRRRRSARRRQQRDGDGDWGEDEDVETNAPKQFALKLLIDLLLLRPLYIFYYDSSANFLFPLQTY